MEKSVISSFNTQLSRMYSLAIINIMLSITGLALNYFQFNHNPCLYVGIFLNLIALFCFQPWKIMGYLNTGYGYKKGLETIEQKKNIKSA
jgi:hypothetical protein